MFWDTAIFVPGKTKIGVLYETNSAIPQFPKSAGNIAVKFPSKIENQPVAPSMVSCHRLSVIGFNGDADVTPVRLDPRGCAARSITQYPAHKAAEERHTSFSITICIAKKRSFSQSKFMLLLGDK
ncbi:hypothetical protein [Desulfonema ishimotonii]|uniref:hypothetical protein n=1 Tax=Desulfonema ishimotonii TaxID=45657 RepID=UPI000F581645|nr:hypothetical protein [Desulfonema ishimotonii]